mmetsp:Transcript_38112/g.55959  ORF Transcript_38112/g.55959 Transcript_38112/m.55959 type:complete len:85 (+) Transcript_38112:195-449(+)
MCVYVCVCVCLSVSHASQMLQATVSASQLQVLWLLTSFGGTKSADKSVANRLISMIRARARTACLVASENPNASRGSAFTSRAT